MQLKRNGWLIWWAWLWEYRPSAITTDVCTVFWRTVFLTPLKLGIAGGLLGIVGTAVIFYVMEWIRRPGHTGLFTGIVVGGLVLVIGGLVTLNPVDGVLYELAQERLADYKAKRCSKIDLV